MSTNVEAATRLGRLISDGIGAEAFEEHINTQVEKLENLEQKTTMLDAELPKAIFTCNAGGKRTTSGLRLVHVAVLKSQSALLAILLEHGATVDHEDTPGNTALHAAAKNDEVDCARVLLAKGANVNLPGNNCSDGSERATPLVQAAANYGSADMAKLLLEGGADKNAQDSKGFTALFWCAPGNNQDKGKDCKLEFARELLSAGAEIDKRDSFGATCLWWTTDVVVDDTKNDGVMPLIRLLIDKGADPTLCPNVNAGEGTPESKSPQEIASDRNLDLLQGIFASTTAHPSVAGKRARSDSDASDSDADDHHDHECSCCGEGGTLLCCNSCPKAYHHGCVKLINTPKEDWDCPSCAPPQLDQQLQDIAFFSADTQVTLPRSQIELLRKLLDVKIYQFSQVNFSQQYCYTSERMQFVVPKDARECKNAGFLEGAKAEVNKKWEERCRGATPTPLTVAKWPANYESGKKTQLQSAISEFFGAVEQGRCDENPWPSLVGVKQLEDDDPRPGLGGQCGAFALKDIQPNKVLDLFRGRLWAAEDFVSATTSLVENMQRNSYCYDIERDSWAPKENGPQPFYYEDDLPLWFEVARDNLVIDPYGEYGCELMCVNDARLDPMRTGGKKPAIAVSHNNASFVHAEFKGWPYVLMVSTKTIKQDHEVLVDYSKE
jgi:hypothetical protein